MLIDHAIHHYLSVTGQIAVTVVRSNDLISGSPKRTAGRAIVRARPTRLSKMSQVLLIVASVIAAGISGGGPIAAAMASAASLLQF